MKLLRHLRLPDWFTLLGIALIVSAIAAISRGHDRVAIGLMIFSISCDFLDGFLASRYGGSDYGQQLDGFYDVLGYLVFPAVYILSHFQSALWTIPIILVTLAGCLRLARFQTKGLADSGRRFIGLPVFYLGLIPIAIYYGVAQVVVAGFMLACSVLMISTLKTPKPRHPVFLAFLIVLGLGFLLWPV